MNILNSTLSCGALKPKFAIDDRLRIENFLDPVLAEEYAQILEQKTPFAAFFHANGRNHSAPLSELQAMGNELRANLQAQVMELASRGEGFYYHGYHLRRDQPAPFAAILAALNSPEILSFIRELTGDDSITYADAQCTQYRPGHFLTRHTDDLQGETRRFAYVVNLTRSWHPDWGGLLQFFEKNGTPRDAWVPGFNVLSLFSTRHIHSVTHVAPFAKAPRHAITGWFRSGTPQKD